MSEKVAGLSDDDIDVEPRKNNKKTDLMKMTGNLLTNINYKVAFLLFIVGIIIFSDVFVDGVLSKFSNTVDGGYATTKGTILQLVFFVLAYILLDLITKYEVI
jgi:hypothetical protein